MDGFIFVGTNFRGLNKNDTFVGFRIRGNSIFFHKLYRKSHFRGYMEFVDWTLHENNENWYPTKFKPSTVYFGYGSSSLVRVHYTKHAELRSTVNVVIFAGGKLRENGGETWVIFTTILLFPS